MTDRPTVHDEMIARQTHTLPHLLRNRGYDYFRIAHTEILCAGGGRHV